MLARLLYFFVLVTYINTIFHQEGHVHGNHSSQVIDGAPLVEIVLEDLFDIPCTGEEKQLHEDLQQDDYRPASSKWISIPPPKKNDLELGLLPSFDIFNRVQSGVNTKISCLIGYYTFLFRLKPF